ncbi:hypothetical protein NBRC110019_27740 [Neptunitalea chrysea]|uniref:FemAB family protein n=1 Tax=Neptunitalea chrysea TaxID=1647581 RepID=A0A9W6B6X2_9FLAO|nr:FemAB family protein [Neptunitalea chrysea]GLB53733.1 hypothetical protein NBRC110019_27740 [Neptunitalea chrysea]
MLLLNSTAIYTVVTYTPKHKEIWNAFITKAKNATFLFHRDFMEYHSDRFTDFSLLVFKEEKLMAVLPANIKDRVVYSHQGLTYGGLVVEEKLGFGYINDIFDAIKEFLKATGIVELRVKQLPEIYQKKPSNELYYLLSKGSVLDTQMVFAVDYSTPLRIHKTKQKYFRQGVQQGFVIKKEQVFDAFWNDVLVPRLQYKHNASPVHTLAEITLLQYKFPENIYQYNIYLEEELLAGITIFETDQVVKSQYGATTEAGERIRAFDYLFLYVINSYKDKKKYFSQGTATESNELGYNPGLVKQKEELGCSIYLQHIYSYTL